MKQEKLKKNLTQQYNKVHFLDVNENSKEKSSSHVFVNF